MWGPENEQAAVRSSLAVLAAGSVVRTEPELVSVEGVFSSALGGVKPLIAIGATAKAEDNTPRNNDDGRNVKTYASGFVGGVPTATPLKRRYG